jgi:hypothetical protein
LVFRDFSYNIGGIGKKLLQNFRPSPNKTEKGLESAGDSAFSGESKKYRYSNKLKRRNPEAG